MKTITLKFDKSLVALAGNPYGRKVFTNQVKEHITDSEFDYNIIIPPHIQKMASSFVQGFFHYWLSTMGIEGIRTHISVDTPHKDLEDFIWDNLT